MEKLTKKQRKEFYLQAAEYFSKELKGNKRLKISGFGRVAGFCDYCQYYRKDCKQFPEFLLFDCGLAFYWFENDKERVTALLLCAAMCED